MLTLKDLKEFDVKGIDVGRMVRTLQQRRDMLFNVILVVVTIYYSQSIMSSEQKKAKTLSTKVSTLEEKVKAITSFEQSKAQLHKFIRSLPPGLSETDEIVTKINGFAIENSIQILSFTPIGKEQHEFFTKTSIKINLASTNYDDLIAFVNEIENSGSNLRVNRWSAVSSKKVPLGGRRLQSDVSVIPDINVSMDIASIKANE